MGRVNLQTLRFLQIQKHIWVLLVLLSAMESGPKISLQLPGWAWNHLRFDSRSVRLLDQPEDEGGHHRVWPNWGFDMGVNRKPNFWPTVYLTCFVFRGTCKCPILGTFVPPAECALVFSSCRRGDQGLASRVNSFSSLVCLSFCYYTNDERTWTNYLHISSDSCGCHWEVANLTIH